MKIYRSRVQDGAPIYFGDESRDMLLSEVDELKPDRVFIVTDRTVETLYAEAVKELLPYASPSEIVVFNEGDENKNLATLQHVAGDLMRAGVTDHSLVLNLGGGGVLDVGGLAASLLGRGIRFAHVATTTNAMWQVVTDDRQAIHFVGGRNAFGLHRAPAFSIADTSYLESEEIAQTRAAFVEFVQLALVLGGEVYDRALKALGEPKAMELPRLESTLEHCIEIKLATYESEAGRLTAEVARHYGYPLARTMQILSEGRLSLAEALYFGMRMVAEVARLRGEMDEEAFARQARLLDLLQMDVKFPANVKIDRFVYQMHGNNKTLRDGNMLVLLSSPGQLVEANGAEPIATGVRQTGTGPGGFGAVGAEVSVTDEHMAEAFEKVRVRKT